MARITRKVGGVNAVDLGWSGATRRNVDIYRNVLILAVKSNDGGYTDKIGTKGGASVTYLQDLRDGQYPVWSNMAAVCLDQGVGAMDKSLICHTPLAFARFVRHNSLKTMS